MDVYLFRFDASRNIVVVLMLNFQAWCGDCLRGGSAILSSSFPSPINPCFRLVNSCIPSSASTIQFNPFVKAGATPVSDAVEVFGFDFLDLPNTPRSVTKSLTIPIDSQVDAIVMFWSCCCCNTSLPEDQISCCIAEKEALFETPSKKSMFLQCGFHTAPNQYEHDSVGIVDHWRQAVFFQNRDIHKHGTNGEDGRHRSLLVTCSHDKDDIWISIDNALSPRSAITISSVLGKRSMEETTELSLSGEENCHPVCTCGLHACASCFRFLYLNSDTFQRLVKSISDDITQCLTSTAISTANSSCGFIVFSDNAILPVCCICELISQSGSSTSLTTANWRIVFVFTSKISLSCAQKLMADNFESSSPYYDRTHFVVLPSDSVDEENYVDSCSNQDSEMGESSSWALQVLDLCEECEKGRIYTEPHFELLHDENILHHYICYCRLVQTIQAQELVNSGGSGDGTRFQDFGVLHIFDLEIVCGVFSSQQLWEHYCGEIGMVEGIDMSAINALMVDEGSCGSSISTREISVRLSQWDISHLIGEVSVGMLTVREVCEEIPWSRSVNIEVLSSNTAVGATTAHGIAVYGIIHSKDGSSFAYGPSGGDGSCQMQAIYLFDQPTCLSSLRQKVSFNLNYSLECMELEI